MLAVLNYPQAIQLLEFYRVFLQELFDIFIFSHLNYIDF